MPSHIQWYLVELEGRLRGRIPHEEMQGVISEIESHLFEASAELHPEFGKGAERMAVRHFGKPSTVVRALLSGNEPLPPEPWKPGWAAIFLMLAVTGVMIVLLETTSHVPSTSQFGNAAMALLVLGALAFGTFLWARRVLAKPLFFGSLAVFAVVEAYVAFGMITTQDTQFSRMIPRSAVQRALKRAHDEVATYGPAAKLVDTAVARYEKDHDGGYVPYYAPEELTKKAKQVAVADYLRAAGGTEVVPVLDTRRDGEHLSYLSFTNFKDARQYWLSFGRYNVSEAKWRYNHGEFMLKAIPIGLDRPIYEQAIYALPAAAGCAVVAFMVMFCLNLLVMGLYYILRSPSLRVRRYA